MRGVPKEWIELVNSQTRKCPKCNLPGKVTDRWHLFYKHQLKLPHINKIWREDICPVTEAQECELVLSNGNRIPGRLRKKELVKPVIRKHLEEYNKCIDLLSKTT